MNIYKRIQIICWSIVFLVFVGMIIWFVTGNRNISIGGFSIQNLSGPYEEQGRYNVELSDINSLNIDWVAGGVTVKPYDGDKIELIEYAQRSLKEDEVLNYEMNGNTLNVKFHNKRSHLFDFMPSKKLEVFVPAALAANLKDFMVDSTSAFADVSDITANTFKLDSVSGSLEAVNIKADDFYADATSGEISLNNIEAPVITLDTISGDISLSNVTSDNVTAGTTSGEIDAEGTITKKLSVDTTSGGIRYDGSFEELKSNATSGDLNVTTSVVPSSFVVDSVSGEVSITMPMTESLNIKHDTVSGKFKSEIPVVTDGNSSGDYRIDTTSGDIDIIALK